MASKTEIANLAISNLGIGKEIQNIDTDNSEEAVACRRYFEVSLKDSLRSHNWSFANRIATLNLVEENPNNEWTYSYRYPSDALKLIKIQSGQRVDSQGTRVVYKVSGDDTAKLIFSDEPEAIVEYIKYMDDTDFYPSDFVMALSYKLSFYIAARITAGDPFQIKTQMERAYLAEAEKAYKNDVNEQQDDQLPESQFILARD